MFGETTGVHHGIEAGHNFAALDTSGDDCPDLRFSERGALARHRQAARDRHAAAQGERVQLHPDPDSEANSPHRRQIVDGVTRPCRDQGSRQRGSPVQRQQIGRRLMYCCLNAPASAAAYHAWARRKSASPTCPFSASAGAFADPSVDQVSRCSSGDEAFTLRRHNAGAAMLTAQVRFSRRLCVTSPYEGRSRDDSMAHVQEKTEVDRSVCHDAE